MEPSPIVFLRDESLALEWAEDIAAELRRALEALEEARRRNAPALVAQALVALAEMRFRLGQYRAARSLAEEVLEYAASDAPARLRAWQVLGNCAAETGALAEAENWYRQAANWPARSVASARWWPLCTAWPPEFTSPGGSSTSRWPPMRRPGRSPRSKRNRSGPSTP